MNKTIAIISCGLIGQAWVISFARAGYKVQVWDAKDGVVQKMLDQLPPVLNELQNYGLLKQNPDIVLNNITVYDEFEGALSGANHEQTTGWADGRSF